LAGGGKDPGKKSLLLAGAVEYARGLCPLNQRDLARPSITGSRKTTRVGTMNNRCQPATKLVMRGVMVGLALILCWQPAIFAGDDERNIEKQAVKRVQPAYPPLAQKYRIEGTVVVQLIVAKDGKVQSAEFVRGHNIFRSVSLDAAKRWEFKPPGDIVLQGTITFTFKLGG
jgi:TonB family protein